MKKIQLILLILLLTTIKLSGQACGGGIISFKIFSEKKQKEIDYRLYYVSREKIDSIAKLKPENRNWVKNQNLSHGIIISSDFANSIVNETKKRKHLNSPIEKNIINVITPELSQSLALITIFDENKELSIITNGGNCVNGKNAVMWTSNPKTVSIDRRVNLEELELENIPFSVDGSEIMLNGTNYRWQYELQHIKSSNNTSEELFVNLIGQTLIEVSTEKSVLDLDLTFFPYQDPLNLSNLKLNYSKPLSSDINFDGYDDFQFHDGIQGGANHEYFVYLFNAISKKFEFSPELTGGSMANSGIELDKERRIAYYSGKNGFGLYGFKRVHFNLDGTIKYEERFWNEDLDYYSFRDSINHYKYAFYYLRKKNNITIDSLRVEKEVNDSGLESIYAPFFEWIRTFDKK